MCAYSHKFPYTGWAWTIKYKNSRCGVQTRSQIHPVLYITKRGSTKGVQNAEVYINYMDVSICSKRSNKSSMTTVKSWLYSSCSILHGTIDHQAVYTSRWLTVTLRISHSIVCHWKKWLVHVRVHNPVWKFLVGVLISLNVRALVLISWLKHFHNPATTSGKQCHSRENFVQNQGEIQERDYCHEVKKLDRKIWYSCCIHYQKIC